MMCHLRLITRLAILVTSLLALPACSKVDGAPCSPDSYRPRCDGDTIVSCLQGRGDLTPEIKRQDCHDYERCEESAAGEPSCVDTRPTCEPGAFMSSCEGKAWIYCAEVATGDHRQLREACADELPVCDDARGCLPSDPSLECDPETFTDTCVDAETSRYCFDLTGGAGDLKGFIRTQRCVESFATEPACVLLPQGHTRCVREATPCPTLDAEECVRRDGYTERFVCVELSEVEGAPARYWVSQGEC